MEVNGWTSLERDAERGFETLGRETEKGWDVEVRFDGDTPPQRDAGAARTRDEAIKVGQEIAKTRAP